MAQPQYFSSSQVQAMNSALAGAQSTTDPGQVAEFLRAYYQAQTTTNAGDVQSGYAGLALNVINNTGAGAVANQLVSITSGLKISLEAMQQASR